ncbi:4-(cytidine 5'-diphospho)-2-C-methyl-D-erythritol kinase [Ideonella livida]|uniref:4-diphosphocytidyl-2-C-methyl-D-erythritol kinase n=1 Tax=Ideonella livida TaxID=2707176 RepID=A0A7C9TJT7_9BURK|nr:4-(cytidine 5'-diphospho)-2-C-methyl-D-erythritol kinase [Ideonella livida]NDY92260.1 4-(cytidine 5'-diphospho)-2-C-methyl-D-erythritol kinase [Ideonella livida]
MSLRALHDLPAPAKLNLFLHVTGRRADGYHLLQSLFVLIDWADQIHLERRADGRLLRHDIGPGLPADDLCLKAARALQHASGCQWGADIHLDKRVPWGAGLGGGSSDAATVLLGLNRLWGLNWPRQRLLALGLTLGADVPFFLGGRNAIVEGIGEILHPVDLQPLHFHVVKPPASAETAKIFSHPLVTRNTSPAIVEGLLQSIALGGVAGPAGTAINKWHVMWGRNDLQCATEALCPEVKIAAKTLDRLHGNARMSGSGSAVFSAVPESVASKQVAVSNSGLWPDGWVECWCRSLTRHPLEAWST